MKRSCQTNSRQLSVVGQSDREPITSKRMKILFLSLRCPYPPHRGDRIRSYHFIKQLSKQHAITLVYFAESESDIESAKHLQPFCERVEWVRFHRSFAFMNTGLHCLSRRPLQLHYWYAPQMQRKVNQLLAEEHFELIHAQLFRMGQYVTEDTRSRESVRLV